MVDKSMDLVVGDAKPISVDVDQVYSVHIWVDGRPHTLVVAAYTQPNGIGCLAGHELLRAFNPKQNFYSEVGDAIQRCRSDSDT